MKPPHLNRILKVAALGSSSTSEGSPAGVLAFRLGELIARRGAAILTGGCTGLPHAAVLGARSAGGLTVAVSPAMNPDEHRSKLGYPLDSELIMFTGMGAKGRNVVLVRSADACIFVGGGMGTLNEFTIAFDELEPRCAIGVLIASGGLADKLADIAAAVGRPPQALLVFESDPEALVERVFRHISRT
ncbi:MAG: hypothetical protein FJ118_14750 [Deltaproteobacteria bacterium]|nr:hypothetical protein [Deltaproteobacteria bacterium]